MKNSMKGDKCPQRSAIAKGNSTRKDRRQLSLRIDTLQDILLVITIFFTITMIRISYTAGNSTSSMLKGPRLVLPGNTGHIDFNLNNLGGTGSISRGPHSVVAKIRSPCKSARLSIKLVGDAIVSVPMRESPDSLWNGDFTCPLPGVYSVEVQWNGKDCIVVSEHEKMSFSVVDHSLSSPFIQGDPLFTDSSWVSAKLRGIDAGPSYLWASPTQAWGSDDVLTLDDTAVVTNGTAREPNNFYRFGELGNYELLCFVGTQSAEEIRREFLNIRKKVFPWQRPFKFHIYKIHDLVHPVKGWEIDTEKRIRKCKHMVVSVDEVGEVSQPEYQAQFVGFLRHLLEVMHDETFPIWVTTVNSAPLTTKSCHSAELPKTSDHPCNDVLKFLFGSESTEAFPSRVHLLDNTDVSNPRETSSITDVFAVIALRTFVVVGKGVSEWRAQGQTGKIDGLHRNGTVEPNFELIPYEGWK